MNKLAPIFLFFSALSIAQNSNTYKIHAHNDYLYNVPFWKAYSAGAHSIEADVFLIDNALYVAHTKKEIDKQRTLEKLYLEPLQQALSFGFEGSQTIQLLIDIKSESYKTLDAIIKAVKKYPLLIKNNKLSLVISGSRPKLTDYVNYPDYIKFDHQNLEDIKDPLLLKKIALISLSFKSFSQWNGKGRLTDSDYSKIIEPIKKAHDYKKPFRFWATPDSKTAWKVFTDLGVDFINTDTPFKCSEYLKTLPKRIYQNTIFSEVYRPTFKFDGKDTPVENIILMIGDGNGLTQISATTLANKGELSLTQLKSIGFLKTQSQDDFTTDSAGAGTALATGEKAKNRAIGVDENGSILKNITEILSNKGFVSGVITTDEIIGATPAAFFAHQKDRSLSRGIKEDLLKSHLSVFVSKVDEEIISKKTWGNFKILEALEEISKQKEPNIGCFFPIKSSVNKSPDPLNKAVTQVLGFLEKKERPFFLMVEGAKIDSYGHANNIGGVINESIAFDQAISEALKYADTHKNTLVIITADHETGGLTIPQGNVQKSEIESDFTTDDHTGTMVPIFAYGPQSNEFQGVYENNEVFHKILKVLGISSLK